MSSRIHPGGDNRGPIDFAALAAALLERAEALVPQWLPAGHRKGRYWYVGDFDGGAGKSANVNLATGRWGDNAGGPADRGADLLSLYRRVRGCATMLEAARELLGDTGWRAAPVAPPRKDAAVDWQAVRPVPDDAPDYHTQWGHYARGVPPLHWEYRDRDGRLLGVVARFNASDGSKDVQPLSWCWGPKNRRQWRYKAFANPRPLYGLWRLGPSAQPVPPRVVLVEGERKADALYDALGREVPVLAWPGGCKVVHLADWAVLPEGTQVLAWPDADSQRDRKTGALLAAEKQPGLAAMLKLAELLDRQGCVVRIVDVGPPGTRTDGWDCADAIAAGWSRDQLLDFMSHVMPLDSGVGAGGAAAPSQLTPNVAAPPARPEPPPEDQTSIQPEWLQRLFRDRNGWRDCRENVCVFLMNAPDFRGLVGYDEFAHRVMKLRKTPWASPPGEWTQEDDYELGDCLARNWRLHVQAESTLVQGVAMAAARNKFHPVRDYLNGLPPWDGTPRLRHWLADWMGATSEKPRYLELVGTWFLMGMVNRIRRPGCQMDYMIVFEGPQGLRKSTGLRTLAVRPEWFADTPIRIGDKDALLSLAGVWLYEVGELDAFNKAEVTAVKQYVSSRVDRVREPFARRFVDRPRSGVFGGSTNQHQYFKDPTGARRMWPVNCTGEIRIDLLEQGRDQLFAEALARLNTPGDDELARETRRYWPTEAETREYLKDEQDARQISDPWFEKLAVWLDSDVSVGEAATPVRSIRKFTAHELLTWGCGVPVDRIDSGRQMATRVGVVMHQLGWERKRDGGGARLWRYHRPERRLDNDNRDGRLPPAQPVLRGPDRTMDERAVNAALAEEASVHDYS